MENYTRNLLWITTGVFLLILCVQAEMTENPLAQVNLSPFRQWRSAWDCMQNYTSSDKCLAYRLKLDGKLMINGTDLSNFCTNGCLEHTKDVLKCIHWVKHDFWFGNGATAYNITETIDQACSKNTSINTYYKSSAARTYRNLWAPLVAYLATVLMANFFNL